MKDTIKKSAFLFSLLVIAFSCNNDKAKERSDKEDTLSKKNTVYFESKDSKDTLTGFMNIEQIEYCLPLPLSEFTEDFEKNDVKAKHVFNHKTKKENEIIIQGMFRNDPSVSIEDYFNNNYKNSEEEGKIIEKKELLKSNNCFYAKGYWSNFVNEFRFIEITWLRKDEIVNLQVNYNISDTALWNSRLPVFLRSNANCN